MAGKGPQLRGGQMAVQSSRQDRRDSAEWLSISHARQDCCFSRQSLRTVGMPARLNSLKHKSIARLTSLPRSLAVELCNYTQMQASQVWKEHVGFSQAHCSVFLGL